MANHNKGSNMDSNDKAEASEDLIDLSESDYFQSSIRSGSDNDQRLKFTDDTSDYVDTEGSFEISMEDEQVESEILIEEEEKENDDEKQGTHVKDEEIKIEIPDITVHVVSFSELGDFEVVKKPAAIPELDFELSGAADAGSLKSLQVEGESELISSEREEPLSEIEEEYEGEEELPFFARKSTTKIRMSVKQYDKALKDELGEDEMDDEDALFRELLKREEEEKAAQKLEEERQKKLKEEKDILEASGAYDLISSIAEATVEKSEEIDPEDILRIKLDKAKIIRQFKIMLTEMEEETRKRVSYTKKILEHFRKKDYKRALAEDDPNTVTDSMNRYRECLARLDKALSRKKIFESQMKTKMAELQSTEEELRKELDTPVMELRKFLGEAGAVAVSAKTGQVMQEKEINLIMEKLNLLRKQISAMRFKFILSQHTLCSQQQELKNLEDIGDGLKVVDFEQLKAETFNLSVKVDERNNEIAKLRDRCQDDMHFLIHIQEKQAMLEEMISKKTETLFELRQNLSSTRNYANELKLANDSVRKEYQELMYNSGLLHKPDLLRDFDATVDEIKEVRLRVNNLKTVKQNLLTQLENINQKLKSK